MTPLPKWIDPEAWSDYEAMRRRIKKPMTMRVIKQKLALLQEFHDKGHDVNAVIDAATNGHWLDFYSPKDRVIEDKRPKVDAEIARRKAEDEEQARRSQSPEAHEARKRAMEALGIRPKLRSVG